MGFYSLEPEKREQLVKEYLATKKRIRDNLLAERTGEIEMQQDLSKFFKPVIEAQRETATKIAEQLVPLREEIEQQPAKTPQLRQPLQQDELEKLKNYTLLKDNYYNLSRKHSDKLDRTFGINLEDGNFFLGDRIIRYDGENYWIGNRNYPATPGLEELLFSSEPDEYSYNDEDLKNWTNMLKQSNVIFRDNKPSKPPKSSGSYKYTEFVKPIYESIKQERKKTGKGVVILPSDPNALLERLDLLMASKEAGNGGVRNELVSVCDELRRQGVLKREEYRNILNLIYGTY